MVDLGGPSEQLARQLARDLGIGDWPWVAEAVRRRHLADEGRGLGRGALGGRG